MLFGEIRKTNFLTDVNSPTFIPKDLYVEASVVVATNNWLSRFGLVLRHANGPWCGDEGYGNEYGLRYLCFELDECKGIGEREC